jgi:AAA15 family ATPase/GTPase
MVIVMQKTTQSKVLKNLRLTDFRGFADHFVPLRDFTVIVGQNNMGKPTIVEALRYGNLSYYPLLGKGFVQMGFK